MIEYPKLHDFSCAVLLDHHIRASKELNLESLPRTSDLATAGAAVADLYARMQVIQELLKKEQKKPGGKYSVEKLQAEYQSLDREYQLALSHWNYLKSLMGFE